MQDMCCRVVPVRLLCSGSSVPSCYQYVVLQQIVNGWIAAHKLQAAEPALILSGTSIRETLPRSVSHRVCTHAEYALMPLWLNVDPQGWSVPMPLWLNVDPQGWSVPSALCAMSALQQAVEVEPMNPNLFWSASEDGTVRQFDKRCRCCEDVELHRCSAPGMAGVRTGLYHRPRHAVLELVCLNSRWKPSMTVSRLLPRHVLPVRMSCMTPLDRREGWGRLYS